MMRSKGPVDKSKRCAYHQDFGHYTRDCIKLKEDIERWMQQGLLKEFIDDGRRPRKEASEQRKDDRRFSWNYKHHYSPTQDWAMSKRKREQHCRSMNNINSLASPTTRSSSAWSIQFSEADSDHVFDDGNDPIVISAKIANFEVKRILIDDGSAVEILSLKAFKAMGLKETNLRAAKLIYGFANQPIKVIGQITLPVKLGQGDNKLQVMAHFLVVDQSSAYNAIFGRPLMKLTQMITAVYCLTIKFPTPTGIGFFCADRATARKCHIKSLKLVEDTQWMQDVMKIVSETDIPLEQLDCREDTFKPQPVEQTTTVELIEGKKEKVTNIGSLLAPPQ